MESTTHHNAQTGQLIKEMATQLGFAACGFSRAEPVGAFNDEAYRKWIAQGMNGKMEYMARNSDKRLDPRELVPGAKTVISLAFNYHQKDFQPEDAFYRISQYAAGTDYHYVLKKKLYQLLEYIQGMHPEVTGRVFTDSAPVLERYWAQKAGLGAPGKNSCLILPRKGSFFFLAELILSIDLPPDTPFEKDMCGKCTRCMDACPSGAIVAPRVVDARKCTSYLTIELKDKMPGDPAPNTERFIFGCDICQQVCPHNIKFATPTHEKEFEPLPAIAQWNRNDWENLEKSSWKRNLVKTRSPMARPSFEKLRDSIEAVARKNE